MCDRAYVRVQLCVYPQGGYTVYLYGAKVRMMYFTDLYMRLYSIIQLYHSLVNRQAYSNCCRFIFR